MAFDVAVIGGGIIGTAAAAYLVEAGLSVVLFEQSALAAGASGRNSGVLQMPFDRLLAELHRESMVLYRELAADGFHLPAEPSGLLLVDEDAAALAAMAAELAADYAELAPEIVAGRGLGRLEPALADGLTACLLATGYPVVPAAATLAFARRAERQGAQIRVGETARPAIERGRATGVLVDGNRHVAAGQVLLAAGPWSPALVPAWTDSPPIARSWGVVVSVSLGRPPGHVIEQHGIDVVGSALPIAFSIVSAGGATSVGSTFLAREPDPAVVAPQLLAHGSRFVPALAGLAVDAVRCCARPVSFDGRPLLGRLPAIEALFVCAGHGPWGISTGPASARLVTRAMTAGSAGDELTIVPVEMSAARWPEAGSAGRG